MRKMLEIHSGKSCFVKAMLFCEDKTINMALYMLVCIWKYEYIIFSAKIIGLNAFMNFTAFL